MRWSDLRHSYRAGCPVGPVEPARAGRLVLGLPRPASDRDDRRRPPRRGRRRRGFSAAVAGALPDPRDCVRCRPTVAATTRRWRPTTPPASTAASSAARLAWSQHAYGEAIDVNPVENPYVQGARVSAAGGQGVRRPHAAPSGDGRRGRRARPGVRGRGLEVGGELRRLPALFDDGRVMDALRAYWDFDDLDATARRFRALRAEALTQLARVEGLRERFDEGDRLLDEAAQEDDARVRIRVDLERGRLRRSSGDKVAALPLFESAFAAALEAGEDWLAGDAAHMCALAAPRLGRDARLVAGAGSSSPRRRKPPRTGPGRSSTTSAGSTSRPASTRTRSAPSSARSPRGSASRTSPPRSRSRATRLPRRCSRSIGPMEAAFQFERGVAQSPAPRPLPA